MANTLRFKRGLVSGIPTAALGEPLFTTDTFDLYIGNGTGNTRFQKYIASGTTSQILRGDGSLYTFPLNISSPTTGQVLKYNGTSWVNDSDAGITGSGIAGQVAYFTGATTQSGSSNFVFDAANNALAINGTQANYSAKLEVVTPTSAGTLQPSINVRNPSATTGTGTYIDFLFGNNNIAVPGARIHAESISGSTSFSMSFWTRNSGVTSEGMRLTNNRNLIIQNGGTFTDSGQRLQVTGDTLLNGGALVIGIGNTSASNAFVVRNSTAANLLTIRNDNAIIIGLRPAVSIYPVAFGAVQNITGRGIAMSFIASDTAYEPLTLTHGNFTTTANGYIVFNTIGTFNPTSGTATYTANRIGSTINQTGGANGITRGLYVNPTLTAAADWRSIEWSNNTGWGLYGAGTAANFLGGSLRVDGVMSQGGGTSVGVNFYMQKSLSGNSYPAGIYMVGTITSTSTNGATMFISDATTQAASFTLPTLEHFKARQTTFGAGSTVTNQYGFFAEGTLTGATNNYGFYGNIASGTGRWNLYMNGSASNYVNGRLLVGTTGNATQSAKVIVDGSAQACQLELVGQTSNGGYLAISSGGASKAFFGNGSNMSLSSVDDVAIRSQAGPLIFQTGGANEAMRILGATRNVHIGTFSSDSGEKLQVNGTMRVSGASTFVTGTSGLTTNIAGQASGTIFFGNNSTPSTVPTIIGKSANSVGLQLLAATSDTPTLGWDMLFDVRETDNTDYATLTSTAFRFQRFGNLLFDIRRDGAATFSSSVTAASFIPTSSTIPTNGMYLSAANTLAFATASGNKLTISSTGLATFSDSARFSNQKGCIFVQTGGSLLGSISMDSGNAITIDNNGFFGLSVGTNYTMTGGNLGIGHNSFGTSATKTISVNNGTAPSSSPVDSFQMYSNDVVAGNAAPHFRTENGAVIKLYQETTAVGNAIISLGGGNAVLDDTEFDGYTLRQIVRALRNQGILQ